MAKLIIREVPDRLGCLCYLKCVLLVFLRSTAERFSSSCLSSDLKTTEAARTTAPKSKYLTPAHIVKQAEVKADAATATVTKELAKRINNNAAPQDQVSGAALRQRVLEKSGEKHRKCSNGTDNHNPAENQLGQFVRTAQIGKTTNSTYLST